MTNIDKLNLEETLMKVEELQAMVLSVEQAIYNGDFAVENYRYMFHHMHKFTAEINGEIKEIVYRGK